MTNVQLYPVPEDALGESQGATLVLWLGQMCHEAGFAVEADEIHWAMDARGTLFFRFPLRPLDGGDATEFEGTSSDLIARFGFFLEMFDGMTAQTNFSVSPLAIIPPNG